MVDPLTAGLIAIGLLVVCIMCGLPVAFSLGVPGMVGILLAEGLSGTFLGLGADGFNKLWSHTIIAIPAFILMGNLAAQNDVGKDLYRAAFAWIGRLPGGLAVASTIFSAMFAFICGSGPAGTATIGAIAIPEMEKKKYDRGLACGTLALGGCLSPLIPPSVLMIIYATQTEVSLGAMFFAGIMPGLLLTLLMVIYIVGRAYLSPEIAPRGESTSLREKLRSVPPVLPFAMVFILVLGGIYVGAFSPIEAGAIGCLLLVIVSVLMRRVTWRRTTKALFDALRVSNMIFLIFIGAGALALMFFITGLGDLLKGWITDLPLPPSGVVIVMMLICTVMGMFVEIFTVLLTTLPVFLPVIESFGMDPIWFGILMLIVCEVGQIVPPEGGHLFIIQSIAPPGTTMKTIIKGTFPFVIVVWVLMLLLIAFPEIVLWLPSTMTAKG